ncbi:hypothetical protein K3495_g11462 [Podosphaera aphanis]|nr:hypothetical protein K3495_g11462 [Podosphaera aphanis]
MRMTTLTQKTPDTFSDLKTEKKQLKRSSVFSFMSVSSKNGDLKKPDKKRSVKDQARGKGKLNRTGNKIETRRERAEMIEHKEQSEAFPWLNSPVLPLPTNATNHLNSQRKIQKPAISIPKRKEKSTSKPTSGYNQRSLLWKPQPQINKNSHHTLVEPIEDNQNVAHELQLKLQAQQEQEYRIAQVWLQAEESRKISLSTQRSVKSVGPARWSSDDAWIPTSLAKNSGSLDRSMPWSTTEEREGEDRPPQRSKGQIGSNEEDYMSRTRLRRTLFAKQKVNKEREMFEKRFSPRASRERLNVKPKRATHVNVVLKWLSQRTDSF